MGLNFQDVIRDVHDPANHALNISGTISAAGQATITPLQAWPDPHTFIGLVTVAGGSLGNSGNVTLNPGPNQIGSVTVSNPVQLAAGVNNIGFATVALTNSVGNATLNPSPNYIGLATVDIGTTKAWADPHTYIGLVTITGALSAAAGNVTLDGGSLTGIKGNVTLSDSKTYIGLTTATIGNNPVLGAGVNNVGFASVTPVSAWPDPHTYIGLVTITGALSAAAGNVTLDAGSLTGIKGNITITDGKTYIGLTTATIGNNPVLGAGVNSVGFASVTPVAAWPDPYTFIGLTTSVIGSAATIFAVVNTSAAGQASIVIDHTDVLSANSKQALYVSTVSGAAQSVILRGPDGLAMTVQQLGAQQPMIGVNMQGILGNQLASHADADATDQNGTTLGPISRVYNGLHWDRMKNANVANATTGLGLLGAGILGFDGTNYERVKTDTSGQLLLGDPKTYIGLVTITGALSAAAGNVTLDGGSLTGIKGNVTLSDSTTYIGLTTTTLGLGTKYIGLVTVDIGTTKAWADPHTFLGLVTVDIGASKTVTLGTGTLNIGSVSVLGGTINANLQTGTLNIGSVSVLGGSIGLNAGVNGIGFATVKVDSGTQFIGLVTAWSRNAGTTKTLVPLPVGLGNNSLATVAVPTNAQKINLTQLILNSNVTTEIAIKSGVTYLTGNASLGVSLNPGGGFVMSGSPDSPVWISLPSGAMVVEKRDAGGTVSKVAGHVVYFDE